MTLARRCEGGAVTLDPRDDERAAERVGEAGSGSSARDRIRR